METFHLNLISWGEKNMFTKINIGIYAFFLLFFNLSTNAQVVSPQGSQAVFLNRGNDLVTAVHYGRGSRLFIELVDLVHNKDVDLEITLKATNAPTSSPIHFKTIHNLEANEEGVLKYLYRLPDIDNREDLYISEGRLLEALVRWKYEDENGYRELLTARLYILEDKSQKFYKILEQSVGDNTPIAGDPRICGWQGFYEIVSPYHFNPGPDLKYFRYPREVKFHFAEKPLRLGTSLYTHPDGQIAANDSVLFGPENNSLGWFFSGWKNLFGTNNVSTFQPEISLQATEGGYFVKKTVFRRFRAQEYVYFRKNLLTAPIWIPQDTGYLDVGSDVYEFLPVPQDLANTPDRVYEILDQMAHPLGNCSKIPSENERVYYNSNSHSSYAESLYFIKD